MHRGGLAHPAKLDQAGGEALAHRVGARARRDQQPPSRGGRERHRHLEFRIIAAAGALIGVGPAGVEHVFAARVGLQIARHDPGDRAVVRLRDEMLRLPAGARAGRAGDLQGGQESMRDERVIGGKPEVPIADWRRRPSARPECPRWSARPGCANRSWVRSLTAESPRKSSGPPSARRGSGLPHCAPSRSAAAGRTRGGQ